MFQYPRLAGTPLDGIVLQTRARREVVNSQSCAPDTTAQDRYRLFRKPHPNWKNRKAPCGVYNCAGLIWANRRTSIYEENEYLKILKDDGYRLIVKDEQLKPGDIIIYLRNTADRLRNTLHMGIILHLDQIGNTPVIWVLSKWSDHYGEDIHQFKDVPEHYGDYLVEFWTDRT